MLIYFHAVIFFQLMHRINSLVIILVALGLSVMAPLSVQGAMAVSNGQNGKNGNANSTSTAKGGTGGVSNFFNRDNSNNGNGGNGGIAAHGGSANYGSGGDYYEV